MERYLTLVGRVLLSSPFLVTGYLKLANWPGTVGMLASKGIPLASLVLAVVVAIEIGGGLLLAIGYQARAVAIIQFLYLIPVTLMFHNFWAFEGPAQQNMMAHFLKNLAIMGGLLFVTAHGAGSFSVDDLHGQTR
jgi:putative oxidoreductase